MKEIKLTQRKVALVDDEDFEYLNQWKWHTQKDDDRYYVCRTSKKIFMHRIVMNTPENMEVDHIDHNGLNNQKSNLRNCLHKENGKNKKKNRKNVCKYKGVYIQKEKYLFSKIFINGKHICLGFFKTEEDAAKAYDTAAKKYFGEFADLNFK